MARKLANLIRIHEWRVDEKRRRLGDLQRMLTEFLEQARRLEEELVREQKVAARVPSEGGYYYGGYAQAVIARRETLAHSIAKTEDEVAAAREDLREAYRELKKYEVAQANRTAAEKKEEDRRETAVLDEVGLQAFIRKKA